MPLQVEIVTPDRRAYQGQADGVTLPTALGEVGILPGHIPLTAVIAAGEVAVTLGGQVTRLAVDQGFEAGVGADAEGCGAFGVAGGVGREDAGDDLVAVIEAGGGAVDGADEAAGAPAEQGEAELAAEDGPGFRHRFTLLPPST